jgi:hypothetical protein
MTNQPEPLDLRSPDVAEDRRQALLRLFPEVRTEGGQLDFERLKLALGEAVDVGKERYGMNWPGKAECFKTIQAPSLGTLHPAPVEGSGWVKIEFSLLTQQGRSARRWFDTWSKPDPKNPKLDFYRALLQKAGV